MIDESIINHDMKLDMELYVHIYRYEGAGSWLLLQNLRMTRGGKEEY